MAGEGKWKAVAGDESSTSAALASAAAPKQKPALQVIVLVSRLLFPPVFCSLLYKLVSHLITVLCDRTSHVYNPPLPPQRSRILSHLTAHFHPRRVLAHPPETLSAAGAPFPVTHCFQRSSRSRPKITLACDNLCPVMLAAI